MTLHKDIVFLENSNEVRIYNPDGQYWPFKIEPDFSRGFKRFINQEYDRDNNYFSDGSPVAMYEYLEGIIPNDLDKRTDN